MPLPRAYSLGRTFISRGSSARVASSIFIPTRSTVPSVRSFVSSSHFLQEAAQERTTGSLEKNARSVILLNVSKRAAKGEVEAMIENAGFKISDIQLLLDRFRFVNNTYAFVELKDEQQAKEAVEKLNGNESLGKKVFLRPLKEDHVWANPGDTTRHVIYNEAGIRTAIQPLIDGRRIHVSVTAPAWGNLKATPRERRHTDKQVIKETFSQFGIEALSDPTLQMGEKTHHPRFLCHIDFQTKEGCDEAIRTMHDTVVKDRRIWVQPAQIDERKAYQIGRASKSMLEELQAKGLAPAEIDEAWASTRPRQTTTERSSPRND